MSYAVETDAGTYLEQNDGLGNTMPDPTQDITVLTWMNNLLPAVVLPAFKTILGLWTDLGYMPDYMQAGIWLGVVQYGGQQCIQLALGDGSLGTIPTMSGVEKRACAISYNATTHEWTLRVLRPLTVTGWEAAGGFTSDFSGTPFTVMRLLNDGFASARGLSGTYFRFWQAILTDDELNKEVQSGVAHRVADLVTDTPLIADTDATDVSGNGNDWTVIGTGSSTILPGPLDAGTSFLMVPDADPAMGSTPTFLCAGRATTTGYPDGTVAVQRIVAATGDATTAACFKRAGGWWQATYNVGTTLSSLVEYSAVGAVIRTVPLAIAIGNQVDGTHDLMELDGGDLLTINKATGDVIRLSHVDGTVAQTYSLNLTTLDGAVNSAGTRLVFIDSLDIRSWNLTDDVDAGTLFSSANQLRCLVWLTDCTLIATTAAYLGDGPIERYAMDGTLILTYAYDPSPFDEGQYMIAASVALNRLWIVGDWDNGSSNEQPGVLMFSLAHGDQLGPVIPLVGELSDYDVVSVIAQPVETIMCDPFPPPPPEPVFIPIRREIEFALMPEGDLNRRKYISRIEVIVQAGIGLPGTGQGSDPKFVVSFSDGGKVWGPLLTMAVGKQGDYGLPVFKNRIGYAYDPRARLITSDPVDWQIVKCTIDVEEDESMP